jgi:branched-chain amino acid transport system substrate-binding protein
MTERHKTVFSAIIILIFIISGCAGLRVKKEMSLQILPEEIPREISPEFREAEKAFERGQLNRAMVLYGRILKVVPRGKVASWSRLRRGEIFISDEKYDEATKELSLIPEKFDGDPLYNEARYKVALSNTILGSYKDSENILAKLLNQKITSSRRAELESLSGDNLTGMGKPCDALLAYMKSLNERPGSKLTSYLRQRIESIIESNLTIDELQNIRKIYRPKYPSGYILYRLARAHYELGDIERADKYLNNFIYYYGGHPIFGKGIELRKRIAEIRLVDRSAIGCILPLTGRFAVYGSRALDAIILATGIFNPEAESPIKLIIEDSQSNPEVAREAVTRLAKKENVIGIIGPLGSTTSLEAAKEAQQLGVPILTLTQREGITETGDYVFRNFLTANMQVNTLVKYAIENLGMESFTILYPEETYGNEMMNLFWDEVLRYGGEIRGVESYKIEQTDFGKEIKSIAGLDVFEEEDQSEEGPEPIIDFDALFIPDSYSRILMIAPQLAFYDVTGIQLLGMSGWNSPELLNKDSKYLEGAIFTDGFFLDSHNPSVRNFIDQFYVALGSEPGDLEALAYDASRIMVTILTENNVEVRRDLKDGLLMIDNYPGITGKTSFSETGDAEKSLYMLMVRDNEIVQINNER